MSITASEMGKKSAASRREKLGEEKYREELTKIAKKPRKRKPKQGQS
jgi:hypothetical protein